jgi:hypothetical protein
LITAPLPPANGNSIGELVAARPARAHPGRLGIKKTGEFSNAIIGENYSATDTKTCLVRFDTNKYSVNAKAVGRPVEIHAYADRIVIRQDGIVVAEHARAFGREKTIYDPPFIPFHFTLVQNIKRDPFEQAVGVSQKTVNGIGGALGSPVTAFLYDWNMLPIGQLL